MPLSLIKPLPPARTASPHRDVCRGRGGEGSPGIASQTLVNAAKILSSVPAAMHLRHLQTLTEIGAEQNSTVVFPMPMGIIKPFLELFDKPAKARGLNGGAQAAGPGADDAPAPSAPDRGVDARR